MDVAQVLAGAIVLLVGALAYALRTLARLPQQMLTLIGRKLDAVTDELAGVRAELVAMRLSGRHDDGMVEIGVEVESAPAATDPREDKTPVHSIAAHRERRGGGVHFRRGPGGKEE